MEKAIRHEFGMSKRMKIGLAAAMVVFIFITVFVYQVLFQNVRDIVTTQAVNSLTNISELNVDTVSRAITNRRTLLETFAANLSKKKVRDYDAILKEMDTYVSSYDFHSMGILEKNLTLHLTSGKTIDASDSVQYKNAWGDAFRISDSYMPLDGGKYRVNLFSCPVYYDGELQYMLTATYYSKNLTERMNISSINGKGYNFILNASGAVVIYPKNYRNQEYLGLMKYINDAPEIIPDSNGNGYFKYEGEIYYACFQNLHINDWYLMTCAREKDIFADANRINMGIVMGMGLFWMMAVAAIFTAAALQYQSKRRIQRAVFYDDLLRIGNGEMLSVVFAQIPEDEFGKMALVIFDIDKFKEFNYVYGEEKGDDLLRYIARIFQEELPDDYLFRYLADHFVMLVHCEDKQQFIGKMEKVLRRFEEDKEAGRIQSFDISAGVRKMAEGDSFRRIMSDALLAKGTVKGIQVQQYAFYDEKIRAKKMNYMEMESDFARALKAKEFHVYYQPKYNMETGKIIGAEALVRWVKGDGTIVSPGEFIPCFEASRQVIMLDEAMLAAVCRQMKEMEAEGITIKTVSVNLSRVHLRHPGILPKIKKIVQESGINPSRLSFEITESALYEDSIPLKQIVDFLHGLGCKVDMDDYGVGVSGPNALASNQFDVIKLDKSFIDGIGDKRTESVIRSTILLSKELGMDILAEGVEEKHQVEHLLEWGCRYAQGFYFSKPVPEETYREMLREQQGN